MDKYARISVKFNVVYKDGPRVLDDVLGSFPVLSLHIHLGIA